jgi:hypothetical protein
MKSTTSERVKIAPRDSVPVSADNFSIAATTIGEGVQTESPNKSKFSCLEVMCMTLFMNNKKPNYQDPVA